MLEAEEESHQSQLSPLKTSAVDATGNSAGNTIQLKHRSMMTQREKAPLNSQISKVSHGLISLQHKPAFKQRE